MLKVFNMDRLGSARGRAWGNWVKRPGPAWSFVWRRAPLLLAGMLFYWLFEASLDVFIFQTCSWREAIFSPDFEETWTRCTSLAILVAFAVVGALLRADLSEEKKLALLREQQFRGFMETSYDGVWAVDSRGTTTFANPSMAAMLGATVQQILGKPATFYLGESLGRWFEPPVPGKAENPPGVFDCEIPRTDGSTIQARISVSPLFEKGDFSGAMAFVTDMTERIKSEDLLRDSLREKEALLKEVHHRVKNNLQVICSLLDLQAASIQDGTARKAFLESRDRVRTMAVLHDRLCLSPSLARVDFQAYAEYLVRSLFTAYGVDPERVHFSVKADNISLGTDLAAPCGLIVYELASNSLKHAFPDGRPGNLVVRFCDAGGDGTLTVSDDGVGFPEGVRQTGGGTLGLTLVEILTRQMGGDLMVSGSPGASFRITIPGPISKQD